MKFFLLVFFVAAALAFAVKTKHQIEGACVCVCLMQIIDPESWDMLFERMKALPRSTRHIVMVTTVPVVYPQVKLPTAVYPPPAPSRSRSPSPSPYPSPSGE